jgi:NitT/TauT family transport system ATP-binding protein
VGIALRSVRHSFGSTEVLAAIDFEIDAGETVALVGPSGCGKSTLLELIAGLEDLQSGSIAIGGEQAASARIAASAWMPQDDMLLPWKRAAENAAVALRLAGRGRAESRRRATAMLDHLGLAGFAGSYPGQLSGGMRQRVAFARTLLAGTPVLLLDEPFASLDAITRGELQSWLIATLAHERRTTVLVTHDVEEALLVADRALMLTARPARVIAAIAAPRRDSRASRAEKIADPAFVAARAEALRALGAAA